MDTEGGVGDVHSASNSYMYTEGGCVGAVHSASNSYMDRVHGNLVVWFDMPKLDPYGSVQSWYITYMHVDL